MKFAEKFFYTVLFVISVLSITLLCSLYISLEKYSSNTINSFNEGNVLTCYGTLVVTNSNWKLVEDHLINNNSAGYVNIQNCFVKIK